MNLPHPIQRDNSLPRQSEHDAPDRAARHAELMHQLGARCAFARPQPNRQHLRGRQFGNPTAFPPHRAPLRSHIAAVVGIGAEEQVRRIHAGRIVAVVQHPQSIGNGAVHQFPRQAMRQHMPATRPASFSGNSAIAIPAIVVSGPEPAWPQLGAMGRRRPVLIDLRPKALLNRSKPGVARAGSATELPSLGPRCSKGRTALGASDYFPASGVGTINAHSEPPIRVPRSRPASNRRGSTFIVRRGRGTQGCEPLRQGATPTANARAAHPYFTRFRIGGSLTSSFRMPADAVAPRRRDGT